MTFALGTHFGLVTGTTTFGGTIETEEEGGWTDIFMLGEAEEATEAAAEAAVECW